MSEQANSQAEESRKIPGNIPEASQPIPMVLTSTEDTMAGNLAAVGDLAGRNMQAAQADSHAVSHADHSTQE